MCCPQWAAKLANEKKGPQRLGMLPTRVSGSGKVYLRLPVRFASLSTAHSQPRNLASNLSSPPRRSLHDGTLTNKLPPKQDYYGE